MPELKKQPFNVIALVELGGEEYDFFGCEARRGGIAGNAIHTIAAVVNAVVGEQKLEEGNATAVGSVAMTNTHAGGVAQAAFGPAARLSRCWRRTHRTWLRRQERAISAECPPASLDDTGKCGGVSYQLRLHDNSDRGLRRRDQRFTMPG